MLHRLILRSVLFDLLKIALLSLAAVSALLVLVGAMLAAAREGLDPMRVLLLMPYLLPPTLPYTVPACLLFACTVVFGSMANNNEITALKSCGISAMTALRPALITSVLCAGGLVWVSHDFVPSMNRLLAEAVLADLKSTMYTYLQQKGAINEPEFPYEIYVHSVRGDELVAPIFKHRQPDGRYDILVQASSATLEVFERDGEKIVAVHMEDGVAWAGEGGTFRFRDRTAEMPIPNILREKKGNLANMTSLECQDRIREHSEEAARLEYSIAASAWDASFYGDFSEVARSLEPVGNVIERQRRKAREANAEVHLRLAKSASTIPFVLLGAPISLLFRRRDFLHTFFVCFLPIVTFFYPAMILTFNVYKEGQLTHWSVLWAPLVMALILSVPIFRHVRRY